MRGLLGTGPPDPTLESASPSPPQGQFGIEIWSTQEIDVESMPNRTLRGEGEADSRVGSRGPVPNKPFIKLTKLPYSLVAAAFFSVVQLEPRWHNNHLVNSESRKVISLETIAQGLPPPRPKNTYANKNLDHCDDSE